MWWVCGSWCRSERRLEKSSLFVRWVCLAHCASSTLEDCFAKPPDSGKRTESWPFPHARRRAGCRHDRPTVRRTRPPPLSCQFPRLSTATRQLDFSEIAKLRQWKPLMALRGNPWYFMAAMDAPRRQLATPCRLPCFPGEQAAARRTFPPFPLFQRGSVCTKPLPGGPWQAPQRGRNHGN